MTAPRLEAPSAEIEARLEKIERATPEFVMVHLAWLCSTIRSLLAERERLQASVTIMRVALEAYKQGEAKSPACARDCLALLAPSGEKETG